MNGSQSEDGQRMRRDPATLAQEASTRLPALILASGLSHTVRSPQPHRQMVGDFYNNKAHGAKPD